MVMTVERTHSTSGNLALAAGAGVAAGFAANLIRKAVMQAPTALSGNWSDALAAEHKMTLASFRSEEHTSELQSLMRISYAVFCLKKKKKKQTNNHKCKTTNEQVQ